MLPWMETREGGEQEGGGVKDRERGIGTDSQASVRLS